MHVATSRDSQVEAIIDERPLGSLQIVTVILCACVALVDGFDTQAIAFVAPVIAKAWSLDVSSFGPAFGAGLLGLTIGALATGPLADRVGRKPIILLSTLVFGIGSLATVLATSINEIMLYRFLTGLGLGGAMPNIIALTSEYAPKRIRALVVTAMFCGFPIGAVIGGLVSTVIIPAYGWKSVFVGGGILPLLLLPVLILWLPESIRFLAARGKEADVTALVARIDPAATLALSPTQTNSVETPTSTGLLALFVPGRRAGTLLLWIAFFCNLLMMYFLINWLPTVLQRAGVPLERAIIATVLFNAGGVVGGLTISRLIDRFGPRVILTSAYLGAVISVAAIGAGWTSVGPTFAVVFAAGVCVMGLQFGMNSFTADYYPTALRATGVGAALGVGRIGSILGPVLGGTLLGMHLDTDTLFHLAAIPALVAAIAIFFASSLRSDASGSAPSPVKV